MRRKVKKKKKRVLIELWENVFFVPAINEIYYGE